MLFYSFCNFIPSTPSPPDIHSCTPSPPDFEGKKERNVLFNDTLGIFYLRLYGVVHVKKKKTLQPHRLLFPIRSNDSTERAAISDTPGPTPTPSLYQALRMVRQQNVTQDLIHQAQHLPHHCIKL